MNEKKIVIIEKSVKRNPLNDSVKPNTSRKTEPPRPAPKKPTK
jgi:hypothetical protein